MFDKTIEEACLIDAAIRSSHSLLGTITEKLQKYTVLKEKLSRVLQMKAVCVIPSALCATDSIPHKPHESLKLLGLRPGLHPEAEISTTQYMTHSSRVFSSVTNKKCSIA
jgi:hypothetical protein